MKILLTGFAPFGGQEINPSWEAVSRTDQSLFNGAVLEKLRLPVTFAGVMPLLREAAGDDTDAVIMTGQAGGRDRVCLERAAVNRMRARLPDGNGFAPADLRILPGGPDTLFSTLPAGDILARWERAGVRGGESGDAGTYVCNRLMYGALAYFGERRPAVPCGFIHLPFLPSQAGEGIPSMPLEEMILALHCCIAAVLDGRTCAPGRGF